MNPKPGIRDRKISRVTEYLMNTLLQLPYGGRLPGIRTVMRATGTGQFTVTHALRHLEQQGLIRITPDRGSFRLEPAETSREVRMLHWSTNPVHSTDFVGIIFRELQEHARAANWKITIENAGVRPPGKLAKELLDSGISKVIVYGAAQPDFARELKGCMKLCLELLPRHAERLVTELRDSPEMTVLQMDYLLKRGYRRIGYLHFCGDDMYQYPVQVHRLMDYYRIMAENGLRADPGWVFSCPEPFENLESGLERIMRSSPKPEVLIVPGIFLNRLYGYCRRHRIRIGRDLAVFSQDEIDEELSPEPTTITNNPVEIAETFWPMFQAAERGEKVESAYTELFIRTGQTVPSLKSKS